MFHRTSVSVHLTQLPAGTSCTIRGHTPEMGSEFQNWLLDPLCRRNRNDDISSTGSIQGRVERHVQEVKRTCDN